MTRSDTINELAAALAKAQITITGATKSSENPHFRSRYADLAAVWDACRSSLSTNGLAVLQFPRLITLGPESWGIELETMLAHESGQWMADTLAVPVTKADAQGVGSAITYARRYALAAVVGVAPEDDDDDGEAAVGPRPVADSTTKPSHLRDRPRPDVAPQTVTGLVQNIVKRPSGTGHRFIVTIGGHEYGSAKEVIAETAKSAREAGAEVEISFRVMPWGREILTIRDTAAEPSDPVL